MVLEIEKARMLFSMGQYGRERDDGIVDPDQLGLTLYYVVLISEVDN